MRIYASLSLATEYNAKRKGKTPRTFPTIHLQVGLGLEFTLLLWPGKFQAKIVVFSGHSLGPGLHPLPTYTHNFQIQWPFKCGRLYFPEYLLSWCFPLLTLCPEGRPFSQSLNGGCRPPASRLWRGKQQSRSSRRCKGWATQHLPVHT